MTRGVAHSPELRAEVVNAVLAGASIREAARQFGLDPTLVSRWAAAGVAAIATQKTESDAELVIRYFRTAIRALITQAEVFGG
jgi:transposase-like protein